MRRILGGWGYVQNETYKARPLRSPFADPNYWDPPSVHKFCCSRVLGVGGFGVESFGLRVSWFRVEASELGPLQVLLAGVPNPVRGGMRKLILADCELHTRTLAGILGLKL